MNRRPRLGDQLCSLALGRSPSSRGARSLTMTHLLLHQPIFEHVSSGYKQPPPPTAESHGAGAAATDQAGAEAPPAAVLGKEFTRTCKGLVVVFIVLLQLLPSSLNYLAIIPAKTIPFVWTVFTAGYIEQVLPGAISSSLGLLFSGKDIEPVWGRKEFLKFIILINSICGVLAFCIAVALYYVTGKESFLDGRVLSC